MLLQIQEPSARQTAPSKPQLALGIDLGTTNSVVAIIGADGSPTALGDEHQQTLVPSAVYYAADAAPLIGYEALARQQTEPKNVICSVKRLMGRSAAEVQQNYRYNYTATDSGMANLETAAGGKSPVEVSADILRFLRERAEKFANQEVAGAVITVPAYFDDAQRQATKDAARLAGLKVLRLLSEPTAAAVAYGLDNAEEGAYLIYDLGGGTFDVSVLQMQKGVFTVLATGGNTALGGDDYDRALAQLAADKLGQTDLNDEDRLRLIAAARQTKEQLSQATTAEFRVLLTSWTAVCEISAAEFAAATDSLTAATMKCCQQVLADSGVAMTAIKQVVLVGGATRMPTIKKSVADFFGYAPFDKLNPDEVVGLGAAAQADLLAGNRRGEDNWLLLDVIPLSLGLETMGGLTEKIILRNTAIPIEKSQEFTTHQDGQTGMSIHVLQGERELSRDCRSLAQFTLSDIPPLPAGLARVRVSFQVDADGLLSVSATERETGKQASVAVRPTYGLDEAQIVSMLREAYANSQDDIAQRQLSESRQQGESLLTAIEKSIATSSELLSAEEKQQIVAAIGDLKTALAQDERDAIEKAIRVLDKASAEFAARRMNADIQHALLGKNAGDI